MLVNIGLTKNKKGLNRQAIEINCNWEDENRHNAVMKWAKENYPDHSVIGYCEVDENGKAIKQ